MNNKGTYDLGGNSAVNLSFINCRQTNDITQNIWWGIFGANYMKNILFDNVEFSRFDTHMGVHNVTIRNSEIGHQGILAIGGGSLIVENTTVRSARFIQLRPDYGSHWEGNIYITNSTLVRNNGIIIETNNDGQWDFFYDCYMPANIFIDGFTVVGTSPQLITNAGRNSAGYEPFPYRLTENIYIKNYSGSPWLISNPFLSERINIITNW